VAGKGRKPLKGAASTSLPAPHLAGWAGDKPLQVCPCCRTQAPWWRRKDGQGEPRCSLCHPPVTGLETEPAPAPFATQSRPHSQIP